MPKYETKCQNCAATTVVRLSFEAYRQVKNGSEKIPCDCGGEKEVLFDPSSVSVVLKDGISGGWASKADKERKYRSARHREMGRRQSTHVKASELVPNYQGQEANSWQEVQEAASDTAYRKAKEDGLNDREAKTAAKTSADTYAPFVKKTTPA